MKKLVLLFSILFKCVSLTLAQSKITEYQSIYFKKSFDVNVSQSTSDTSKYEYYIDCASADALHKQVDLDIVGKDISSFIDFLNSVKIVYGKWKETAKANNITELEKEIDVKPFQASAAFVYGKWNFDFHVLLSPRVKIIDGKFCLILSSGELQSSSNEYIKHDGLLLVFTTVSEVDDFINAIDINKAKAFFNKKNKTDNLFKN